MKLVVEVVVVGGRKRKENAEDEKFVYGLEIGRVGSVPPRFLNQTVL